MTEVCVLLSAILVISKSDHSVAAFSQCYYTTGYSPLYRVKIHGIPGIEVQVAKKYLSRVQLEFDVVIFAIEKLSEKLTAINKNKLISLWVILMD